MVGASAMGVELMLQDSARKNFIPLLKPSRTPENKAD